MKSTYIYFLLLLVIGCRSNNEQKEKAAEVVSVVTAPDSTVSKFRDAHYYWESDLDPKEGLIVKRSIPVADDSLNLPVMISRLNSIYPEIPVVLRHSSYDTVFLQVTNSRYLSQQMGSSGPEAWIAEVVYNITELPSVHYVDIRFKARDHGAPGTYSRTDFTMR